MRFLCFGSLNLDRVYRVHAFVRPGETISASDFTVSPGGKGLNQSIALARAGADVYHAGAVGKDGGKLRAILEESGVHTEHVATVCTDSGHAVIQVSDSGQNSIIISPGANGLITEPYVDQVLGEFGPGDILLLQNEISKLPYIIRRAKERGMQIAINPSPLDDSMLSKGLLQMVDQLIVNELEGAALAGLEEGAPYQDVLAELARRFPKAAILLTVGSDGAYYKGVGEAAIHQGIYDFPVVDTTAAGDTFCGYFMATKASGMLTAEALRYATMASSIAVSRIGAGPSIPMLYEVAEQLEQRGDCTA